MFEDDEACFEFGGGMGEPGADSGKPAKDL